MGQSYEGELSQLSQRVESHFEKLRTEYEQKLERDRAFIKSIVARASIGIGVIVSIATYFGFKGFDDLIDRAVDKTNVRERYEAQLREFRDVALVSQMRANPDQVPLRYADEDIQAFHRLLKAATTRDQLFLDVLRLLNEKGRWDQSEATVQLMAKILSAAPGMEWITTSPRKQEALISYLADGRFGIASSAVEPYLDSPHQLVQLAAIRYVQECHVVSATSRLPKLLKAPPEIASAASVALATLDSSHAEAQKWIGTLEKRAGQSLNEAARVLAELGTLVTAQRRGNPTRSRSRGLVRTVSSANDPGNAYVDLISNIVRTVLLKSYFLTLGELDGGRRVLYVAANSTTWSETSIPPELLSPAVVDTVMKSGIKADSMDNFRRFVRGLSGIVTGREIDDLQQEVVLSLGEGEIEFSDGRKVKAELASHREASDRSIAAAWAVRRWILKVSEKGDLIGVSTGSSSLPQGSTMRGGVIKSITLAEDSSFSLRQAAPSSVTDRPYTAVQ